MTTQPQHVVMFSGGIGSYCAARRVVERHGPDAVTLLFCDTRTEDEDLYRFLEEAAAHLGCPVTYDSDGRDVWQVFRDKRYLGNSRVDPCSRILKRERSDAYLKKHHDPLHTIVYVGIDWSEEHRFRSLAPRKLPWVYQAPMCEAPFLQRADMLRQLQEDGLAPPRLYALGFEHNNCGGFCIKAGKAHFRNLLKVLPERYAYHEAREQDLRDYLQKNVAILRDRRSKQSTPLTLRDYRLRLEAQPEATQDDLFEWGGCGCFSGALP